MLQISERSNEELSIINHGENVFHDALELVKKGEKRFHVDNPGGEDYDLTYVANMDLFPEGVKDLILQMTKGADIHPAFLDYNENNMDQICIEFLEQFNNVEFEVINEYAIVSAKIILKHTDIPVAFSDERIKWFINDAGKLTIKESFSEDVPKGTLRITPSPIEFGTTKSNWSFISSTILFQNLFFWQVTTKNATEPIKYAEVGLTEITGIGGVLSNYSMISDAVESKGWKTYLKPNCTRYSDDILSRYFNINTKPDDATVANTADFSTEFPALSITWYFGRFKAGFDETIINDRFIKEMDEYMEAVLPEEKVLGVLARGTDYVRMNLGDDRIHATVEQMVPRIREWMTEGGYKKIFLATEDQDIFDKMRKEFPNEIIAIAQERHSVMEFKEKDSNLIFDFEKKIREGKEYDDALEDTTVNYFYALYILSKCDAFICSGQCNGWDVVRSFNHGRFDKQYKFTVGITGEPATEDWKVVRPLGAGVFARAVYPENKAFYMTYSFDMEDTVSPNALKVALDKTMQVYPYFTYAIVKRNRVYYLVENPLDFVIKETDEIIEPSKAAGNFHAITICYKDKKLNVYVDHVPTDGTGLNMVFQTFFYYYFSELDGKTYPVPEGVRTVEDGVPEDAETDAYSMVDAIDPQKLMGQAMSPKEVFEYPEKEKTKPNVTLDDCGHYSISVDSDDFMKFAKSVGGTPSSVLVQLIGESLQRLNPDNKLPLEFTTPVSVRKVMGNPNSLLHQVVHKQFEFDSEVFMDDKNEAEINADFRKQLAEFASPQSINIMCGVYHGIVEGYKKAIGANVLARVTAGMRETKISASVTHMGTISTSEYGNRIHIDNVRVMPEKSIGLIMLEVGGKFYISFCIGLKEDKYARFMAEHMQELGMKSTQWKEVYNLSHSALL